MKSNYRVWYLPRGLSGGDYIYGTVGDTGALLDHLVACRFISSHGASAAARIAAEIEARRARSHCLAGEICSYQTVDAAEKLALRGGRPYDAEPNEQTHTVLGGLSYLAQAPG